MSFGRFSRSQFKNAFFDREAVLNAIDKKTKKVLSDFGSYTRGVARRSIRRRKKYTTVSPPGKPPYGHGQNLLKTNIFHGYDKDAKSVVIGPARLYGKNKGHAPSAMEYGSRFGRKVNPRRRVRKINDSGIIQVRGVRKHKRRRRKSDRKNDGVVNQEWKTTKLVVDQHGKKRWVTFTKLLTHEQVNRSMRLEEEIFGPMFFDAGKVEARPFMGPAMDVGMKKLPDYWKE